MKRGLAIAAAMLLLLSVLPAHAGESMSVTAKIPVENLTDAGWFALKSGDEIVSEIFIRKGDLGFFEVTLTEPDSFVYTVEKTREADHRVSELDQRYTVHIITYLQDDEPEWISYAEKEGVPGKAEMISFYRYELLPEQWVKPSAPPQTG